ncbi:peptidoglycan D,D-transpeptidase FtsI family protein [Thermocrispum agreste]|jgi:peptidoglycan glycosyltransferase|uniref:peptidoglycan D,D-transpeptidase FtsI family protein n=1 Tax=Thermocrispum agreste TaxID=37925 RepID=UPI00040C8BC8|nr:penicillin-binding protein 2 [Thermocrispum agreste]
MNTPLRRVGLAMLAMVALLLANATYIQVVDADDYRDDPRNQRVLLEEYSRQRGQIIARDGKILAHSRATGGRYEYQRRYPNGPMFAPVTGYYSLRYGSGGMEHAENEILAGNDARLLVRRLSDMFTGRDPRGGHVRLTIDPRAQEAAYRAMVERGHRGAVVALRPDTGEILAMVSVPSYDPNQLASHDGRKQERAWIRWNCDPDSDSGCREHGNPMRNRAIQEFYPPGSTFKLVVAAAALENGATKDTKVESAASVVLPGTRTSLSNFAGTPCPGSTLEAALAHSCNTAFSKLAAELGADKLRETAENFGIGIDDLEIPMSVVPSHLGELASDAELYQAAIGQRDVRLTPLQDALLSATIANRGMAMRPQLVRELLAPALSSLDEFEPEELTGEPALSAENAEVLRDMMIKSEQNTRGAGAYSHLKIASKTGTAEHGARPKETPPHAWYTAFAPYDDPKVAVAVIVESGGKHGDLAATGGALASEIGRITMAAVLEGDQ